MQWWSWTHIEEIEEDKQGFHNPVVRGCKDTCDDAHL